MTITLAWWIWFTLGILLIISEVFLSAFVLLWYGIGCVITGLLMLLFLPALNLGTGALIAALSGSLLLLTFRRHIVGRKPHAEQTTTSSSATLRILQQDGQPLLRVAYRGTYWAIANPDVLSEAQRQDGQTVLVARIEGNRLYIQPPAQPEHQAH